MAGLLGVLSVAGRIVVTGLQRHLRTPVVVAVVFAVRTAAASLLPITGGVTAVAVGAVIGFGVDDQQDEIHRNLRAGPFAPSPGLRRPTDGRGASDAELAGAFDLHTHSASSNSTVPSTTSTSSSTELSLNPTPA
ncbi:hypothetical protein [Plantactinospora endophytica]|uniref:hypothetical protein n=1 Tax=Plantactinospora endophytica TaxID=673535 RepID=UPI0019408D22|nr:hypothetical protein [Plantactinospora endophytica]